MCGPRSDGPETHPCQRSEDCGHGLCALSGTCVEPCRDDGSCPTGACRSVSVWRSVAVTSRVDACVSPVVVPPRVSMTRTTAMLELSAEPNVEEVATVPARGDAALQLFAVVGEQSYDDGLLTASIDGLYVIDDESWAFVGSEAQTVGLWGGAPVPALLRPGANGALPRDGELFLYLQRSERTPVDLVELRASDEGMTLDLDFYVVTDAADARARVETALPEAATILGAAGIALGEARFHALPSAWTAWADVPSTDPWSESSARFLRASAGTERPTVPVFLVRSFLDGLLGEAPGIPGPQGIYGTDGSGVLVAIDLLGDAQVASTIVHEIGHFFGLSHSTESDGEQDALDDTPACTDTDGDGLVLAGECAGRGAENVMFWAVGGTELSPSQAAVMRSAFVLR